MTTTKLTIQYRLPTTQHGTTRLLDIEINADDLPKVNSEWSRQLLRAYYDLPEMAVDVIAVGDYIA